MKSFHLMNDFFALKSSCHSLICCPFPTAIEPLNVLPVVNVNALFSVFFTFFFFYFSLLGDDWEHEEIFTDDEEAMDPEEREDLAPEIPAPPEIRQARFSFF